MFSTQTLQSIMGLLSEDGQVRYYSLIKTANHLTKEIGSSMYDFDNELATIELGFLVDSFLEYCKEIIEGKDKEVVLLSTLELITVQLDGILQSKGA